jgi:hypothetical protein
MRKCCNRYVHESAWIVRVLAVSGWDKSSFGNDAHTHRDTYIHTYIHTHMHKRMRKQPLCPSREHAHIYVSRHPQHASAYRGALIRAMHTPNTRIQTAHDEAEYAKHTTDDLVDHQYGAQSCDLCQPGNYTDQKKSLHCTQCPAGSFIKGEPRPILLKGSARIQGVIL